MTMNEFAIVLVSVLLVVNSMFLVWLKSRHDRNIEGVVTVMDEKLQDLADSWRPALDAGRLVRDMDKVHSLAMGEMKQELRDFEQAHKLHMKGISKTFASIHRFLKNQLDHEVEELKQWK